MYCLAWAAMMTGVRIIAFFASSNHHHLAVEDVEGRLPDFFKLFHTNLAKHQNVHHGLFENMWSPDKTSAVWCVDFDDLIDKVVYLLANPVKDGLVEKAAHWPGAVSLRETLEGRVSMVARPSKYFDPNGAMPDEVELRCGLPEGMDRELFVQRIREGIEAVELQAKATRSQSGQSVVGARTIRNQRPTESPSSKEKRFTLNPHVASKAKLARIAAIKRLKTFRAAYADARAAWLKGLQVFFPFGTWWLRLHANVPCGACPT